MNEERRYLRPDIIVEPLVAHWYAWPLLISPVSAAQITKKLHAQLLASYAADPALHAAAAANPNLRGGPFINHTGSAEAMAAFHAGFATANAAQFELADAIDALARLLRERADGGSMQSLYDAVPEVLRGCVELVYDLEHAPAPRLIEPLLYASRHYDAARQQIHLIDPAAGTPGARPFVLSTPRFEGPDSVLLDLSFADPMLAELLASRQDGIAPARLADIADACALTDARRERFFGLFGATALPAAAAWTGPGVRVRYFGHATVLVETADVTVLADPLISYDDDGTGLARYSYRDLPAVIDYVVLTHNHQDHVVLETLLQIRHRIRRIVLPRGVRGALQDPSLRLALQHAGFHDIVELDEFESLALPGGQLRGLPFLGEHGDLNIQTKLAYALALDGVQLVFAADSNNLAPQLYDRIHALIGPVDVLFIGMECVGAPLSWLYGPMYSTPIERRKDQARRLDGSDAARADAVVDSLAPRRVCVYAMGAEPWLEFISSTNYNELSVPIVESDKLIKYCHDRDIQAERLYGRKEFILTGRAPDIAMQ